MTEVTSASIKKFSSGNEIVVKAALSNIQNAFTWTVPHLRNITFFSVTTSTDDDVSGTVASGNVITFACGATLAGMIKVEGF